MRLLRSDPARTDNIVAGHGYAIERTQLCDGQKFSSAIMDRWQTNGFDDVLGELIEIHGQRQIGAQLADGLFDGRGCQTGFLHLEHEGVDAGCCNVGQQGVAEFWTDPVFVAADVGFERLFLASSALDQKVIVMQRF
jgi:hypothetical protein